MAKTDKELAVELAGKIVEAAFDKEEGEIYRNAGGGSYLCKRASGSESARMVNVKSGWDFIAHGLRRYFDGSIEWDYSTGGCFGEVPV